MKLERYEAIPTYGELPLSESTYRDEDCLARCMPVW
jgi:hypothetical protein